MQPPVAAEQRAPRPAAARAAGRRRLTVVAAVRAKSKRQICCSKTLVARPEAADQVAKMCADVAEFTQAKMAERSAGINAFDIVRDQWEVRRVSNQSPSGGGGALVVRAVPRMHAVWTWALMSCSARSIRKQQPSPPHPSPAPSCPHPPNRPQPNVFHLWERYESNTAMGRHNTTPELTQFMEKVVPLLEQPVGMALYEWQNGQLGPVSLQGGEGPGATGHLSGCFDRRPCPPHRACRLHASAPLIPTPDPACKSAIYRSQGRGRLG